MMFGAGWHAAMLALAHISGECGHIHRGRDAPSPPAIATPTPTRAACAFIPWRTLNPSPLPNPATSRSNLEAKTGLCHRGRAGVRERQRLLATAGMAMSGIVRPGSGSGNSSGASGVALWLDMRTAVLPAAQTLKTLYGELRQREEALGRSPDDPDWTLSRVPNPVGALLYAADPAERAAEEMKALGATLPCFQLSSANDATLVEVSSGDVVGVGMDPFGDGRDTGNSAAGGVVAAAQRTGCGDLVLLRGVRPSVWEGGDMGTILRIASSACVGAGKTLVVSVRSVGQLHDAAMAAFAASQTQVLGGGTAVGGKDAAEGRTPPMALLIEPLAELWEAGLLYL